ncbi:electron transport complex protein RnfB [Sulfurivirga caldicuralii]|uniref:Ion-translocating oxidoreductase complex subunit B n=1 Tax=Sulfurivirga caldicuralii TaxID=364032 RepID=A0A1N6FJM4_9GAMM|nr:electron transport complex subunit RsxB [Sulfurivirga caldicuralii]SIN95444.1 electron transport complex protein RnfB [Sulfurivirga caldicuralii]
MLSAILIFLALALVIGALLGYAAVRFKVEEPPIVEEIDSVLPQIQCGQCGYPGCRPYAEAVANGEADINQCTPGGEAVMLKIAEIMHVDPKPLKAAEDGEEIVGHKVAFIHEDDCIGCMHCIKACPVDAIVGTTKAVHTVILKECTGCELCVPVCPTDCIEMRPEPVTPRDWIWPDPEKLVPTVTPPVKGAHP